MSFSSSNNLIQARKLIDEGEYDTALQLIKNTEKTEGMSSTNKLSFQLLECDILIKQGLYEKGFKLAEKTHNEGKKLGTQLLSFDALIFMVNFLFYQGLLEKAVEIIKQAEEFLQTIKEGSKRDYKEREAHLLFLKSNSYASTYDSDDFEIAIEYLKQCISIWEELGNKRDIIRPLLLYALFLGSGKGEIDLGISYTRKALKLAEESKCKHFIAFCLKNLMELYSRKGEFDQSLIYGKQSLNLFENLKFNREISSVNSQIADQYRRKGDFNLSLKHLKQALISQERINAPVIKAVVLASLVEVSIALEDIELVKSYLNNLEEINEKVKIPWMELTFRTKKANLLATSPRAKNRIKAENIYKDIIEELGEEYSIVDVYLGLCELLLFELEITSDMELVDEVESYIAPLLRMAGRANSFWLMGEIYLLKAKLTLFRLDLEEARQLLTKCQQIAEKYELKLLAMKISNEHDELFKQLNLWEDLKRSNIPLQERFELTGLKQQMKSMLYKRAFTPVKLEAEKPILLIIIKKNEDPILFNHFTADMVINDMHLGEFLASCNVYCNQIFSETFDRVKLGQYMVLISSVDGFSICYLFQGQTYSAQQKLKHFSEALSKDTNLIGILKSAESENRIIQVNNYPHIEELILESFMSDPNKFRMPFKAYLGDDPYVFVSYAHADKLEVYPIIDYLNKMGIKIWYDEGIPVSENWIESIAEKLLQCSAFLVFISPHIIDSEYVRKEISYALKKNKVFIAIYLKQTKLPAALEFEISGIQAIMKYLLPRAEFLDKLHNILNNSIQ